MLDPVDDGDLLVLADLEDDAVVATAGDPEAFESANERPAEPLGVLGERAGDGRCDGGAHLGGEPVSRVRAFGSDLELIHPVDSEEIAQWKQLPLCGLETRLAQRVH